MLLKPLFRLPQKMNFHFVKYFRLCFALSIVAIVGTVILLLCTGLNFGIDFKGGTLMQVHMLTAVDAPQLRTTLHGLGIGEVQLQNFGRNDELLIRFPSRRAARKRRKSLPER